MKKVVIVWFVFLKVGITYGLQTCGIDLTLSENTSVDDLRERQQIIVCTTGTGVVENVIVPNGETFPGKAFHTLTLSPNNADVIVEYGGSADFVALDEVHALPGFHAQDGSETHLYNDVVRVECSDITDANYPNGFRFNGSSEANGTALELVFKKINSGVLISVNPNPTSGTFTVNYYGVSEKKRELKIYDILGNLILNYIEVSNSSDIDLSAKPKGIYFLLFNDQLEIYYQKIVVQ